MISLEDLISANPKAVIGDKVTALSKQLFGKVTWPIVAKKFDNLNPNPDLLHWSKLEVYDINSYDNPGVSASHYHTTAMGLYAFVTKEQFLACMKRFGKGEYNGIRHVAPHVMMQLDNGFVMPNGVLHSPTNLCTHELHVTTDEHFLAEGFKGNGVDARWNVYGNFLGDQKCSILRLIVEPGARTTFRPECPAMFHTNGGSGRVGKLGVRCQQNMILGEIYPEIGFITQAALANGGVEIDNTGTEPLVLTFDFPQNAHSRTPGVASA